VALPFKSSLTGRHPQLVYVEAFTHFFLSPGAQVYWVVCIPSGESGVSGDATTEALLLTDTLLQHE
jgi:hypothetical protein